MAKQNEKKPEEAKVNVPAMSEDNVMDRIKDQNRLSDKNVKAALEKIEKDKDERKVKETTNMIMCAEYNTEKELIGLRARRREANITKETLKKNDEVLAEVLEGKITPSEYREKKREINKEKDKKFCDSRAQYDKEMQELKNSYTGEYCYMAEWDRY
jgi:hypothetical protein